jgi:hypothetical protein
MLLDTTDRRHPEQGNAAPGMMLDALLTHHRIQSNSATETLLINQ